MRGTPEQCAEQIAAYVDAGVKHLVFCPYNYQVEQVYRLATEVLPLLARCARLMEHVDRAHGPRERRPERPRWTSG